VGKIELFPSCKEKKKESHEEAKLVGKKKRRYQDNATERNATNLEERRMSDDVRKGLDRRGGF